MQADVGSPGSEQHAKREQMLRASLAMQTQLKVCRQELQTLNQQLAAQSSASVPLADLGVNARSGLSQTSAVAAGQAVNMVDLFGSDDEVEDTDDPPAVAQPAQGKPGKSARSAVPSTIADNVTALHMPTTHATQHLPSARLGNPSSLMSVPAGSQARGGMLHQQKQQAQAFDPAKAKRSISFNNSIRRSRQVAKQRSQVFNDAADAAVAEAAATARLKSADANATELASQLADAPERNKAPDCIPRPSTQPRAVAPQLAMPTASAAAATVSAAAPAAAAPVPTAAAPAPIPSAPARSASATVLAVLKEPETTVTRPIHAEVAPKLKMGSRLAANMAKLAASRKATSAAAVPPASTAAPADVADKQQAPVKKEGKKSAIPEDIKRKLLAKASLTCQCNKYDEFGHKVLSNTIPIVIA